MSWTVPDERFVGYLAEIERSLPSRRERIATAALQGLLASDTAQNGVQQDPWSNHPEDAAARATRLADALIAELDKSKETET